ncbi:hypothetical protein WJX81_008540 [Elliptochloris bilobata]|uniref:FAD dependent oxidoreductase domain-containing protein n=1 Tax=Elliptochloris bilobata TaxID=381761 RepID=A0AAW1RK13_9CHLO
MLYRQAVRLHNASAPRRAWLLASKVRREGRAMSGLPLFVPRPALRFAVIGGGFAGCAVAWHLLAAARAHSPIAVTLYDGAGLCGGASRAAAGLLHPFTPRGRLLWRGDEAVADALELVAAAEAAAARAAACAACDTDKTERDPDIGLEDRFVWRQPLMRPARNEQQAREFAAAEGRTTGSGFQVSPLPAAAVAALAPGMCADAIAAASAAGGAGAALLVQGGLVLHPERYLRALWEACRQRAADIGGGCAAQLVRQHVPSLVQLQADAGPFDAVVVAAGAAVGVLPELRGLLPLELCQGFTLELAPPSGRAAHTLPGGTLYPAGAPSLLGEFYVAAQGRSTAVVGATRRYGLTPLASLAECGKAVDWTRGEAAAAACELQREAAALWPAAASWQVAAVRSGVRAMPPRTQDGKEQAHRNYGVQALATCSDLAHRVEDALK